MYGSDAGQPARSLYTKGLLPLCDMDFSAHARHKDLIFNILWAHPPKISDRALHNLVNMHQCTRDAGIHAKFVWFTKV